MLKQTIFNAMAMFSLLGLLFFMLILIRTGRKVDALEDRLVRLEAIATFAIGDSTDVRSALEFVLADQRDSVPNTPFERKATSMINSLISWRTAMNHFVDEACDRSGWDLEEVRAAVQARMNAETSNPKLNPNE